MPGNIGWGGRVRTSAWRNQSPLGTARERRVIAPNLHPGAKLQNRPKFAPKWESSVAHAFSSRDSTVSVMKAMTPPSASEAGRHSQLLVARHAALVSRLSPTGSRNDLAEFLDSDEALAACITESLLTGEVAQISHAIGVAARARKMVQIAEDTGLSRESLYRALSTDGNPQLDTIVRVLSVLGLQLRVEPCEPADA